MNEQTYVIWLEFDGEFGDYIDAKCIELDNHGIPAGIRPPHLTLTFAKTDQYEKLVQYVTDYFAGKKIEIIISTIGQFSGGNMIYLPKANEKLLGLHKEFCQGIYEFGELAWDLYYPGNWTPHIALTGELNYEDSLKAFSIMKKGFKAQTVQASRILVSACKGEENIYIPLASK